MLPGKKIHPIDLLAIWLVGADLELREMALKKENSSVKPEDPLPVRQAARMAMKHAHEMYTPDNETDADPETDDPEGVKGMLARFAASYDREIRERKENA